MLGMRTLAGRIERASLNAAAIADWLRTHLPAKPAYKRWKQTLPQIMNWDRFDMKNFMTVNDIDAGVRETGHKGKDRGASKAS